MRGFPAINGDITASCLKAVRCEASTSPPYVRPASKQMRVKEELQFSGSKALLYYDFSTDLNLFFFQKT